MSYRNQLCTNQLAHLQEVIATRDPKQESDWVAYVSHDEFYSQWRVIDVKISTPPGEKTVSETKKSNDTSIIDF